MDNVTRFATHGFLFINQPHLGPISAVSMTTLKLQTDFTRPYLLVKGKSSKNISWVNSPIIYKY
jgi:hypothetical protein